MSGLPLWAQWIQWGGTFFIAGFVAFIGYRQWRTAHQRVIMDLFDKRFDIVNRARAVVAEVVAHGSAPTETVFRFGRETNAVRFLFGSEVQQFLEVTNRRLTYLHLCEAKVSNEADPERAQWIDRESETLGSLTAFFTEFNDLVAPYLQMHQRVPAAPKWVHNLAKRFFTV